MARVRARLLITGDELLRGFIQDANSGVLAASLRELGVDLEAIRIVGDEHAVIEAELERACGVDAVDLVVVTGGLGPTHDDRTSEAVARACGRSLELDESALAVVEQRVRAYGRMRTPQEEQVFAPGNRKQATMPEGATWVDPLGTAPGYVVEARDGGTTVVVLPGPPSELRHAWLGVLATDPMQTLLARVGTRHERLIRVWGVPESEAARQLGELGHEDSDGCRVTICARDGELEVAVRGTATDEVDGLVAGLHERLAAAVFAVDDERGIVELVAEQLAVRGWTLATAESCTGGLLAGMLTGVAGASSWFLGGITCYANEVKERLVGVDAVTLAEFGAVSEPVARQLAAGVRVAIGSDVGIGITGIAGPGGGSEDKPVGTVHIAVSTPAGEAHRVIRIPGDRATVRRRSCTVALHELRRLLGS